MAVDIEDIQDTWNCDKKTAEDIEEIIRGIVQDEYEKQLKPPF